MLMRSLTCLLVLLFVPHDTTKKVTKPEAVPELVRMAELLGNPEHFSGKRVSVVGYLVIGGQNINADSSLSLDKEDYLNDLGNGIGVVPNQAMVRNGRELSNMYVILSGVISTHERSASRMLVIGDVTECKIWSDPQHPRALRNGPSR